MSVEDFPYLPLGITREQRYELEDRLAREARLESKVLDENQLCEFCRGINIESLSAKEGHKFHTSQADIEESGRVCKLCKFFALQYHCRVELREPGPVIFVDDEPRSVTIEEHSRLDCVDEGRIYAIPITEIGGMGLICLIKPSIMMYLRLSLDEGCDEQSRRFGLAIRKRLTNTASDSSFETIRKWISTCDMDHDCCPMSPPQLQECPAARLIDVQAFEEHCLDARLVETTDLEGAGKYVTLSHCWGEGRTYITNSESKLERMKRIVYSELSRTFQDAVKVTRELGIRYLWIDSICIIQGDEDDWAIESAKMCDIYACSYVLLAADGGIDSESGLFNTESVLQDEEPLGEHVVLKSRLSNGEQSTLFVSFEETSVDEEIKDGRLATRGWTLQESILAPRVLHYTRKQVVWECQRGYDAEDIFKQKLWRRDPETMTGMKKAVRGNGEDGRQPTGAWYTDLIEKLYSSRRLTVPTDKLPAIAGVARWAAPALGCDYIAGMWRKDFEWALTWAHSRQLPSPLPSSYRSPSFSWASTDGKSYWATRPESFLPTIKIEQLFIDLEDNDPFGRVKAGWLRLSGFISRLTLEPKTGEVRLDRAGIVDFDLYNGVDKDYDWKVSGGREEFKCLELGLGYKEHWSHSPASICLMVLAPIPGKPQSFKRIGLGQMEWEAEKKAGECGRYREKREWQTVTIY